MMITIHGLPPRTNFQAVKTLVKQECNIIDFILDNLVDDGPNSKKVRIGVSDDTEGYRLMKCLDGFRMSPTHLLKIVPVGKSLNPPQQNYEQRSGFTNQTRNEYTNQSRPDYQNQSLNDYGHRGAPGGPHGPQGPTDSRHGNQDRHYGPDQRHLDHAASDSRLLRAPDVRPNLDQRQHIATDNRHQPHRVVDTRHSVSLQGSQDTLHPQPWALNANSSSQWGPQATGSHLQSQNSYNQRSETVFGQQHPPSSEHYPQGRGAPDQGYGFPSKPSVSERSVPPRDSRQHVLRSVELVDTARAGARPYHQDKPITIMKDNFQGPGQYTSGQQPQHTHFPGQEPAQSSPWAQPSQPTKPQSYDDRRHMAADKRLDLAKMPSNYDKRDHFSPTRNRALSPGRRASPSRNLPSNVARNYQEASPIRPFSIGARRVSPTNRLGPSVREFSPPSKRASSPGRRALSPGRRALSPGRRASSPGRRASSPGRRVSPAGRRAPSPGRRVSPAGRRAPSPGRKGSPGRRMSPGRRDEPRRMSPSMMHYDYKLADERRLGRHESPRRFSPKRASPAAARRLVSPPRARFSPNRDKPIDKFMGDGKTVKPVRPAYEPTQAQNQTYTGGYRDSAPYGGRPEPWADKIMYPSKKDDDRRDMARRTETRMDKSPGRLSRSPRRERSPLKDRYRRHSPSPRSSRSPRRSWALEKRSSPEAIREPPPPPIWPGRDTETRKRFDEPKREPVWELPDRRGDETRSFDTKLRVRTDLENKFDTSDRRAAPRDETVRPEFSRESPRREEKKPFSDIDKDFQDIYKRAIEFRKKTEERKSGERRRDDFEERYRAAAREDSPRRDDFKSEWNTQGRKRIFLSPLVKSKRDKAVDEICHRVINKYDIDGDHKRRVMEELKVTLSNIFMDMFSDKDVSFIELVIKYQSRHNPKEEEKLMQDVLSRLPSQYRNLKRKAVGDVSEVPTKTSRRSPQRSAREERKIIRADRRNYVARLHAYTDRNHVLGYKSPTGSLRRPPPARVREITRKPVFYAKTDVQDDTPVKKAQHTPAQAKSEPVPKPKATVPKKPQPPSVEPTRDGHYELSPLLSKVLESELDDVMNKVWSMPQSSPRTKADEIVVAKFKNEAGVALRKTIGLNVTKRLLNVHNPLYVKMVFSDKPLRADLVAFLKKHNITAFKRAGTRGGTFAAKMRNFQDFDELCTNKTLLCGTVEVTVTPCYQFMTCPPNLRTCYDGIEDIKNSPKTNVVGNPNSTTKPAESQEAKPKAAVTKPNQEAGTTAKATPKQSPVAMENQNSSAKATLAKPAGANNKNAAPVVTVVTTNNNTTQTVSSAKSIATSNQTSASKVTPEKAVAVSSQTSAPKVTQVKADTVSSQTSAPTVTLANANTVSSQTSAPKVTPDAVSSQTSAPKVTEDKAVAVSSQTSAPKVTPVKATPASTITLAKLVTATNQSSAQKSPAKPGNNQNAAPKITPKPLATDTSNVASKATTAAANQKAPPAVHTPKMTTKSAVANQKPTSKVPNKAAGSKKKIITIKPASSKKKQENDYDELDDHDILALISEGIVLDECSGSDDEI